VLKQQATSWRGIHSTYNPISKGFFHFADGCNTDRYRDLFSLNVCKDSTRDQLRLILLANARYEDSLKLQQFLFDLKRQEKMAQTQSGLRTHYLVGVEHIESCFTIGKLRFDETFNDKHFIKNERNLKIHKIGRGGGITFHAPGQLVLYPIFDLESVHLQKNIKWFSEQFLLTQLTIPTLQQFVNGFDQSSIILFPGGESEMGIYSMSAHSQQSTCKRKLASIGLQLSRWCTMHGIAINFDLDQLDLSTFREDIVACGLKNVTITTLFEELNLHLHSFPHFTTEHYATFLYQLLTKFKQISSIELDDILVINAEYPQKTNNWVKPDLPNNTEKNQIIDFVQRL